MVKRTLGYLVTISMLCALAAECPGQNAESKDLRAACASIMEDIQNLVSYIANRLSASEEARGQEVCDKAVKQLNMVLENLRWLRRAVSPLKRNLVDEVTRKVAGARFLIIADCCSKDGMESLQGAQDDLARLMEKLQAATRVMK